MTTPNDKQPDPAADDAFANKAKSLFDDSVARLDAATLSQLNQRRQAALEQVAKRPVVWLRALPVAGLAAAAVVAVVVMQGPAVTELPAAPDSAVTDFEILLSDDSLEMIEELEFYSWLDAALADTPDNVG